MQHVLVTGGAGFIGSHLVSRLLDAGEQVTVLDNFNDFYDPTIKRANVAPHLDHRSYTLVEGDLRDSALLKELFKQNQIDQVIHLAAMAGVRPSLANPLLYQDVNINGTMNILENMKAAGVRHLVFASSSSVYGNNEKLPFAEDDAVDNPISPYAATKKAGELLCYTYHHLYGIKTACLRLFTVYGPRQRPEMAIHLFTDRIERGEPIQVFAEGQSRRDYTFIDDIVDGIVAVRTAQYEYEIINLGRSDTVRLSDLIDKLQRMLGRTATLVHLPGQPGDVDRTYASIDKARRLLGYKPKVSIDQGLERFVEWYRSKRGKK